MRRHDLLDEFSTAIGPGLAPQALMTLRPGMLARRAPSLPTTSRRRVAPVALAALVCVLLAFV